MSGLGRIGIADLTALLGAYGESLATLELILALESELYPILVERAKSAKEGDGDE